MANKGLLYFGMRLTLTAASICGVAIIPGDAALALFARGEILTSLTHTLIHTRAVAVTLTRCIRDKHTH